MVAKLIQLTFWGALFLVRKGNKFTGALPSELCKPQINSDFFEELDVDVTDRDYCESIACPAGYSSLEGVWPCQTCASGEINPYLGLEGSCFPTDQTRILRQFYDATAGENWTVGEGNPWFTSQITDVCQFSGITCSSLKHVTGIELPGRNLRGTIPRSIGFLEYLETLDLSNNSLSGFIPSDLRFAPLTKFSIADNKIIGIVPPKLCMKTINGNGVHGTFRCDLVACPAGTYSNTGISDDRTCMPCNDADSDTLGRTSCGGSTIIISAGHFGSITSVSYSMSPRLIFGIVVIVLSASAFLIFAIYRYRKTLREEVEEHELSDFDLSDNNLDLPTSYPSMPPPSAHLRGVFPDQVVIEEMDDDFSSITRIRKKKAKKKKKKDGAYSSVISEGNDDSNSADSNPLWLDVPRLDSSANHAPLSPHQLT